jgi:hypothetical protein
MDFEVYCDESRQELFRDRDPAQGRYVLIGGVWIDADCRSEHKAKIRELRETHRVVREFKWKNVSPSRQEFYCALVRLFFEEDIRFRCIVLPAEQLDCRTFHEGDEELMFYKFYYQLLDQWIADSHSYRIFLDLKTNRVQNRVDTLQTVLRNANPKSSITVQALPSRELDLLQVADVLLGAVAYDFHKLDTSTAKLAVVHEIEKCLGHPIRPTARNVKKFNVFLFRPGERR